MLSSSTFSSEAIGRIAAAPERSFLKVFAVTLLALASLYGLAFLAGAGSHNYDDFAWTSRRLEAKLALAERQPPGRILVLAGSNAFFNVRAKRIETATGRPAINLATHADNGLRYLDYLVRSQARPGDVMILPIELNHWRDAKVTEQSVYVSYSLGLDYFWSLPPAQKLDYLALLDAGRILAGDLRRLTGQEAPVFPIRYNRFAIDAHGDIAANQPDPAILAQAFKAKHFLRGPSNIQIGADVRALLRELGAWAKANRVTLAVAPPGIVETRPIGAPTRQQMRAVLAEAGITFLELPGDGLIPQEMLYDTFYHAAAPGSELYTARLIEALCARFGSAAGLDCRPAKLEEAARPIQTWQRAGYVLPKANLALTPAAGTAPPRWQMTGRQASFTVVKMSGCANRLVLAAGPSSGSVAVSIDGRSVAELALSPTAPRQAVLPLGGSAGLTTVTLARGPDRAGPASALAFARLTRESACPPSPAAAPPGAAAALGRAQPPGPPA